MHKTYIRRYTNIPALIYLLREQKITLIDPQFWDDSNDSYFLKLYRKTNNLESVLALCFTRTSERYHHWRVFANGSSGVYIRFNRSKLLEAVKEKEAGLLTEEVEYLKIAELGDKTRTTQELPFIKRYGFKDEREFRIVYKSKARKTLMLDIPIPLLCINKIRLSPWLHEALVPGVTKMLKSIKGCSKLKIEQSALISSEAWKKLGDSIAENA